MQTYDDIFFDLDGTLTDPGEGITNAVTYALKKLGAPVPAREALYAFIGPPLLDSFQRYCGFTGDRARAAVTAYREYFGETGIFENKVYPGVPELLAVLRDAGRRLVIATSKPEPYALRIAERYGLTGYFDRICGATMDETRTRKEQVIRYALERCGGPEAARVLMVGDREQDVLGARACGVDCLGVLYGYGSRAELSGAGAAYLAETPAAAGRLILG